MPGGSVDYIAGKLGELRRRWNDAGRPASGPVIWAIQEITDDDAFRADLEGLAHLLEARAGVIEHGLFINLAQDVIVAGPGGIRHLGGSYTNSWNRSV